MRANICLFFLPGLVVTAALAASSANAQESSTGSPPRPKAVPAVKRAEVVKSVTLAVPTQSVVLLRQGDKELRTGSLNEAAQAYARAVLADPQDPLARMTAGVALAELGMHSDAVMQFRKATEYAEDDPIASLLLQGALLQTGDGAEAQEIGHDVVRRWGKSGGGLNTQASVRRLTEATKAAPQSPVFHLLLGDAYQLSDEFGRAETEYKTAIILAPRWAKPRVNLGLALLARRQSDEAVRTFEQALALDPANAQARVWKGDAERQSGRGGDAIETYRPLLSTPGLPRAIATQARTGIGLAFASVGKVERALDSLDQAQKLSPADPTPSALKGEIQVKNGNFTAAAGAFGNALNITRGAARKGKNGVLFAERPVLYRSLAEAQLSARKPEQARETLQRALDDEPDNAPLWHRLLAQAAFDNGNKTQGATELRAALEAEQGPYPLDTLRAIDAQGLLPALQSDLERDRESARTNIQASPSAGGFTLTNRTALAPAPQREAVLLAALANLAHYQNDTPRENTLRDALSLLRSRGWDWYAMADMYDQRVLSPSRAAESYRRALEAKDAPLSEAAARRARQRLKVLTEAQFKP